MTAPINLANPDELRDYVSWSVTRYKIGGKTIIDKAHYIDDKIYTVIPDLTKSLLLDALDYATTEGPIDYSRLAYYIEKNLPEEEECGK
jgi:hypothetical protein